MKKYLLPLLLATKLLAGDSTNAPKLSITNQQVNINSSATARVYSLLENPNLMENNWTEVESKRGTGSNLTFLVNQDSPQKFYRARADYSPVSPTNFNFYFNITYTEAQRSQGYGKTYTNILDIVNYTTNPIKSTLTWTETLNYWFSPYTNNLPKNLTLNPGTNRFTYIFTWLCNDGGTQVWGDVVAN